MKQCITAIIALSLATPIAHAYKVQGIERPDLGRIEQTLPARYSAAAHSDEPVVDFTKIINWSGSGDKEAALVLQWGDGTSYAFGYRYDSVTATGYDMLTTVVANNPQLYVLLDNTVIAGTSENSVVIGGAGFDTDCDREILVRNGSIIGDGEDGIFYCPGRNNYNYDDWTASDMRDKWDAGWLTKGYWQYLVSESADEYPEYSQVGMCLRELTDGAVDCWKFTSFSGDTGELANTTYAPVEESAYVKVDNLWYAYVAKPLGTVRVISTQDETYSGEVTVPAAVTIAGLNYTVTELGTAAFANSAITAITLPSSIGLMRDRAFAGCELISKFTIDAATPPALGDDVFSATMLEKATLKVPEESADTYALTEGWKEFKDNASVTPPAKGDLFMYDGICYRVNSISGSTGKLTISYPSYPLVNTIENKKLYVGDLTVYGSFKYHGVDFTVSSCDVDAFNGASDLKSVDMSSIQLNPSSTAISFFMQRGTSSYNNQSYAFKGCTSLVSVKLPSTGSIIIPSELFKGCTSLKEVSFPAETYRMYNSVFEGCTALEEITLPEKAGLDGSDMFAGCTSLRKVVLSRSWSYGGSVNIRMFDGCTALEEVTLMANCQGAGVGAFRGCKNLKVIKFLDQTWSSAHPAAWTPKGGAFSESAFEGCGNLPLELPSTVTLLGKNALKGCKSIVTTDMSSIKSFASGCLEDTNIKDLSLSSIVTSVQANIFGETTPDDVRVFVCSTTPSEKIDAAFVSDSTPVYVPFGTKGEYAAASNFTNHNLIELQPTIGFEITEPNGTPASEPYAGTSTHAVVTAKVKVTDNTVDVPEAFKLVNTTSYISTGALKLALRAEGETEWQYLNGTYADGTISCDAEGLAYATTYEYFWGEIAGQQPGTLSTFTTNSNVELVDKTVVRIGNLFYTYHLPEEGSAYLTVASVPSKNQQSLTNKTFYTGNIIVPVTVTYNGETLAVTGFDTSAMNGATDLISVTIEAPVTELPMSVFSASGLQQIDMPESLKTIGSSAFANTKLTEILLHPGLETINGGAFLNTKIEEMTFPSTLKTLGKSVCEGMTALHTVIFDGEEIESIPAEAFQGCTSLKEIVIPASVKAIDDYAFNKCTSLTYVEVPEGLETIGNYTFWECSALDKFTVTGIEAVPGRFYMPDSLRMIGNSISSRYSGRTFSAIPLLKEIRLPETIEHICSYAFDGSGLTHIDVPAGLTSISQYCFNKTSLDYLVIPENIKEMGSNVVMDMTTSKDFVVYACGLEPIPASNMDIRSISVAYSQNPPIVVPPGTADAYKAVRTWWYDSTLIKNTSITEAKPMGLIVTTDPSETGSGLHFYGTHEVTFDAEYPEAFRKGLQAHYTFVLEHKPISSDTGIEAQSDDEWAQVEASIDADGKLTAHADGISGPVVYRWHAIHPNGEEYDLYTEPTRLMTVGVETVLTDGSVRVNGREIICPEGSRVFGLDGTEYKTTDLGDGIYVVVFGRHAVKVIVR